VPLQLRCNEKGSQRYQRDEQADGVRVPIGCERSRKRRVALVLRGTVCSCL